MGFLPKKVDPKLAEVEAQKARDRQKMEITTKLNILDMMNGKLEAVVHDTTEATQELALRLNDREPTMNDILLSPEELFGVEEQVRKEIEELEAKLKGLPPVPNPPLLKP